MSEFFETNAKKQCAEGGAISQKLTWYHSNGEVLGFVGKMWEKIESLHHYGDPHRTK